MRVLGRWFRNTAAAKIATNQARTMVHQSFLPYTNSLVSFPDRFFPFLFVEKAVWERDY